MREGERKRDIMLAFPLVAFVASLVAFMVE